MSGSDGFQDRLLAAEQLNPEYQEKYNKEVRAMLEKKLTPVQRWGYVFSAILGVVFLTVFGTAAIVARELPILARIAFGLGAVFGLASAAFAGSIAKKGTLNLREHPTAMTGMVWGFVIIMMTLFLLLGARQPDSTRSVFVVVSGLVFFVMAGVFMIFNRVDQAELKTREKLLEIEYRVAEIAESLSGKKESK